MLVNCYPESNHRTFKHCEREATMEEKVAFGKLISAYRVYNSKQETASMDVARSGGTGSG